MTTTDLGRIRMVTFRSGEQVVLFTDLRWTSHCNNAIGAIGIAVHYDGPDRKEAARWVRSLMRQGRVVRRSSACVVRTLTGL